MPTRRTQKWYEKWWIKYVVFIIILIVFYLLANETINQSTISKYLTEENQKLVEANKAKDIKIDSLINQKEKIKVIRERVSTKEQEDKIKKLEKELGEIIKKYNTVKVDTLTPEKLNEYFLKIINK